MAYAVETMGDLYRMMNEKLFAAQEIKDKNDRIADLLMAAYMAEKARCKPESQASMFCGAFSGLLPGMRFCDIPDYVDYLRGKRDDT